jgi:hypothetical protein
MILREMFKCEPDEMLLYLETNVNYLFQKFPGKVERQIEVGEVYQPEKGGEYLMPYVWLDKNSAAVELFESQPDRRLTSEMHREDYIRFFVHPEMIHEYREKGLVDLLSFAGEYKVKPTASTRTVMTRGLPYNYMIKANMEKLVGFLRRKMKISAVRQSNQIMSEFADIESLAPESLAYLPETIGVVYDTDIGMLIRECQPKPKVADRRYLIPFFSLISLDAAQPEDPLLLCQIVENQPKNPFDVFSEMILLPLIEAWAYLVFERGILPIPHMQNLLLEIDKSGTPTRIVLRDLQDAAVDLSVREEKGLHRNFYRHFVDDIEHNPLLVDSERINDAQTARKIRYSLNYDFWLGKVLFDCFTVVLSKYPSCNEERIVKSTRKYFQDMFQNRARELFPSTKFFVKRIDHANPSTRIVENRGKPKYR